MEKRKRGDKRHSWSVGGGKLHEVNLGPGGEWKKSGKKSKNVHPTDVGGHKLYRSSVTARQAKKGRERTQHCPEAKGEGRTNLKSPLSDPFGKGKGIRRQKKNPEFPGFGGKWTEKYIHEMEKKDGGPNIPFKNFMEQRRAKLPTAVNCQQKLQIPLKPSRGVNQQKSLFFEKLRG